MSLLIQSWCAGSVCDPCKPKPPSVDCTPIYLLNQANTVTWTSPDRMSGWETQTFPTGQIVAGRSLCSQPHCLYTFASWYGSGASPPPTGISFNWSGSDKIDVSIEIDGGFSFGGQLSSSYPFVPASEFIIAGIPSQIVAKATYSGAPGITVGYTQLGNVILYV